MMQRLTRRVLQHKRFVAIGWLLLTIVGIGAAGPASEALDQRFSVPGREGWEASQEIQRIWGNGGETLPLVPVVTLPKGTTVDSPGVRDQLTKVEETARNAVPRSRVAGFGSTGDKAFVSKDGRTAFVYVFAPRTDDPFGGNVDDQRHVRDALKGVTIDGAPVRLTGYDALFDSSGEADDGPGVLLEALFGGAGALVVLIFVFGSALALVPLGMAICSVLVSFLLLWGLTAITDISPIVQFIVALIGLGVSIDYALLIVIRWREEREKGLEGDEAVISAMGTAGRAVVFSGTTVAVGLLALVVLPLPFLRSMGYGGLLIPLVATACAITLLPVILASVGPRMDRRRIRRRDRSHAFWTRWAELIVRRRGIAAFLAIAVLGVLVAAATNLHMGNADPDTIAKAGSAKVGLQQLDDSGIGKGAIAPTETVVPEADAQKVVDAQSRVENVHGAAAPDAPDWRKNGLAIVAGIPRHGDESQAGRDAVQDLIAAAHGASPDARVGGTGPLNADFIDAVYGSFPLLIAVISILTFVLLARAFRSLLLPLKAIILNILSIGAAWGIMELVWQQGHGSDEIWGIAATGSIASWIPFIVFAFLYGLSMDYEVFILARVREEYDITHDTNEAVIFGLGRTGRLVTSAALILFLAFAALASGPETDVKVLATGLAAGILLDATVVRAVLVPALVSYFGRWNWWMPAGIARVLRVRPSEPVPEASG
ncbi:MAG TPA: MMPL family transporter [Solirubrobacteraceae bacterium]|jgi:RND superfamily putative drug exporter|nr:MMPL family transporter [Solirubrobacteraceae bacterium]